MEIWLKEFLFWLYSSKTIENEKFFKSIVQYTLDYPYPQSIEGFKGQIEAIKHFNLINELPKIHSETLVLTGEEDILIKPKETDLLYQGITRASYPVYIEKTAHAYMLNLPKPLQTQYWGFI